MRWYIIYLWFLFFAENKTAAINFHEIKSYVDKAGLAVRETDTLTKRLDEDKLHLTQESEAQLEQSILQLEIVYANLRIIYIDIQKEWTQEDGSEFIKDQLIHKILELMERVRQNKLHLDDLIQFLRSNHSFAAPTSSSGQRGRPKYTVLKEQLDILLSLNMSWVLIAKIFGISVTTLWRRRTELGLKNKNLQRATDDDVKAVIASLHTMNPKAGIIMVEAELNVQQMTASRERIRKILLDIDPHAATFRWNFPVHKFKYEVRGPNSLWHIDGNHKLSRRWKIVVHGGIDGFSRMIVFLQASSNNRASTVLSAFSTAVEKNCWPSRIRIDKGTENVDIEQYMNEKWGPVDETGRLTVLKGPSVLNQRIERLWRDVRIQVLEYYRKLFFSMEAEGVLDPSRTVDLFCLHLVYIPRINAALEEFVRRWNAHKLSSEHCMTPNQLYAMGMLQRYGSGWREVKEVFDHDEIDDFFGVEMEENGDQPEMDVDGTDNSSDLNSFEIPVQCATELQHSIDPLRRSVEQAVDIYLQAKEIVTRHVPF